MNGRGVLYYGNGEKAYEGEFENDKFEGVGILYNSQPLRLEGYFNYNDFDMLEDYWVRYEGQFKKDFKEGFGMLFLSNEEVFKGNFKQDFVYGAGKYV